jgi:hypothetical protein
VRTGHESADRSTGKVPDNIRQVALASLFYSQDFQWLNDGRPGK